MWRGHCLDKVCVHKCRIDGSICRGDELAPAMQFTCGC